MKIAIVVGHNEKAQGAVRVTDGRTEYDWNSELAAAIRDLNPKQVMVFHRKHDPAGYTAEIHDCYARCDMWGADVSCELHFNSFTTAASGTETLFATKAGKAVAEKVQAAMVGALGLRDRGLLHRPSGRGAGSLIAGKAPAVLVEPYFGSNPTDCLRADERFGKLAEAIFSALGGAVPVPLPQPSLIETRLTALEDRVALLERMVVVR